MVVTRSWGAGQGYGILVSKKFKVLLYNVVTVVNDVFLKHESGCKVFLPQKYHEVRYLIS